MMRVSALFEDTQSRKSMEMVSGQRRLGLWTKRRLPSPVQSPGVLGQVKGSFAALAGFAALDLSCALQGRWRVGEGRRVPSARGQTPGVPAGSGELHLPIRRFVTRWKAPR